MRVLDCPIEVRLGADGPSDFCWRGLWWQVQRIESRWIETTCWWDSPAARAVRSGGVEVDPDEDLLGETEFLRVVAGTGRRSTHSDRLGVFELAHTTIAHPTSSAADPGHAGGGQWRLSRVID